MAKSQGGIYVYEALDPNHQDSFRLAHLRPGSQASALCINILNDRWSRIDQPYEALSYTWGDHRDVRVITIDDCLVEVTSNLESALRHLRLENETRVLWIDAICIDQSNLPERSAQVSRMFDIYQAASKVVVWLGENLEDNRPGVELLVVLGTCCAHFKKPGQDAMGTYLGLEKQGPKGALELMLDPKYLKGWLSLSALFQRPWWHRAWVCQELYAAKEVTFICGTYNVPSRFLLPAAHLAINRYSDIMRLLIKQVPEVASNKDAFRAPTAAFNILFFRYRNRSLETAPLRLDQLLASNIERLCQDPRDKVYSILCLAEPKIKSAITPDYALTIEQVYQNAFEAQIQAYKSLHMLPLSKHPDHEIRRPSWLPDWTRPGGVKHLSTAKYSAAGHTHANVSFPKTSHTMFVSGFTFDTIGNTAFEGLSITFRTLASGLARNKALDAWNVQIVVAWLQALPISTFQTTDSTTKLSREDIVSVLRQTLTASTNAQGQRHTYDFEAQSDGDVSLKEINTFMQRVQDVCWDRTLVVSQKGYLGLAPRIAKNGDLVAILFGCSVPVILRREESGGFLFVGDVYIHTIMDGEAMGLLMNPEVCEERFLLV